MDHGRYGFMQDHHDPHVLAWLFFFLLLALVIVALAWLVLRLTGRLPEQRPVAAATGGDAALETVRMRYARGEIDHDEFARLTAGLGGGAAPLA